MFYILISNLVLWLTLINDLLLISKYERFRWAFAHLETVMWVYQNKITILNCYVV